MIAEPSAVVLTAQLARWVDEHAVRIAWIVECLARHNAGDWGDLDHMDTALNDASFIRRDGRVLSRYIVPEVLFEQDCDDNATWIITDKLRRPGFHDDHPLAERLLRPHGR